MVGEAETPPDTDYYAGVQGVHHAWDRVVNFLTVEIPGYWDDLQSLLARLQALGAAPPGGGAGGPPAPPPPAYGPYDIRTLDADAQAAVRLLQANWNAAFALGSTFITLGPRSQFTGINNIQNIAIVDGGYNVFFAFLDAELYPPGPHPFERNYPYGWWVPGQDRWW